MSLKKYLMPWMIGIFLVSCISQTPSELKSNNLPLRPYEASCSDVVFEGQILNKKNLQNIFLCTGWSKLYPDLHRAIQEANVEAFDHSFEILNKQLFENKKSKKKFFNLLIDLESNGQLDVLAKFIELSLQEHNIFTQLNQVLQSAQIGQESRTSLMKVFSHDKELNIKNLQSLKNLLESFELQKTEINKILDDEDESRITNKFITILDEVFSKPDKNDWALVSEILDSKKVNIQNWFFESAQGDVKPLLKIITDDNFVNDMNFLKNKINDGIECKNLANQQSFYVSVDKELKHIISSLTSGTKEEFSDHILHGMAKYVAFQEFCQEKVHKQGLDSFIRILKHINSIVDSEHDYIFLKGLHKVFGANTFKLVDFLASSSFSQISDELRLLHFKGQDEQLVFLMHQWLSDLKEQDYAILSQFIGDLASQDSRTSKWYKAWTELWPYLSLEQKEQIVKFMSIFFSKEIDSSKAIESIIKLFEQFPDLSPGMAKMLDDQKYQVNLRYVIALLSEGAVQKDMSKFLSNKGLFELFRILTRDSIKPKHTDVRTGTLEVNSLIEQTFISKSHEEKKKACFNVLHLSYVQNSDYYLLVNNLPDVCKASLGQSGFVGQIYLWMNFSNAFFESRGIKDYHSGTGVWSPPMLHFLFSSGLLADQTLISTDGKKGIRNNLDEIHRFLTKPDFLEIFHRFSGLVTYTDKKINLSSSLNQYINKNEDDKIENLIKDLFAITNGVETRTYSPDRDYNCKEFESRSGPNPCVDNETLKTKAVEVLRILKRRNESGKSLIKELLAWLHPASQEKNHTSIDETVRFLYDLSSKETSKSFIYRTENETINLTGTTIDRLEVLIRDIGFLNNYFGSYFKNEVASAINYRQYLISSKKTMAFLDVSSPAFRVIKGLPEESAWKLKNVRNTYQSLIEISDKYKQPDGSIRSYDKFIQGLLQSIVRSSKLKTQDFKPYRYPKEGLVDGHNGIFLTRLVEMSALRHLSTMARGYLSDDLRELDSKEFKMINQNLISRMNLSKLQNNAQSILDKYLDNDQKQINQVVSDIIELKSDFSDEESQIFRDISFKFLLLLSNTSIEQKNIEKLGEFIEPIIKSWNKISPFIKKTKNKTTILKSLNHFLDMMNQKPDIANRLISELLSLESINQENLNELFEDEDFLKKLFDFINFEMDFDSNLNWKATFEAVIAGNNFKFSALKSWLVEGLSGEEKKLSLMLLISVLGEKNEDGYRLKYIFDELFLNHRSKLEQFLVQTFSALSFKPDQKSLSH